MKNKIKKFIQQKGTCKITDILAEFLISFNEAFPVLCELYSEHSIKQTGNQTIVFLGDKKKQTQSTFKTKASDLEEASEIDDLISNAFSKSSDFAKYLEGGEDVFEEDEDFPVPPVAMRKKIPVEVRVEKILYEEVFSDKALSRGEAIILIQKSTYDERLKTALLDRIKNATNEEIEMFRSGEKCPEGISWASKDAFENKSMDIIEQIVSMDIRQTRQEAICIAKDMLEKAKATDEPRMVEVYMRVYYEFRVANEDDYDKLKRQIFS